MFIHTVRSGETLLSIAKQYRIRLNTIIQLNHIKNPAILVSGQSLIIPSREHIHTVMPGENLWLIAKKYRTTLQTLAEENKIKENSHIYPGQKIKIPANSKRFGTIEVNAFIEAKNTPNQCKLIRDLAPYITYLCIFSYRITKEGTVVDINDEHLIATAFQNNVAPLMVISNYHNGIFDSDIVHCVLSDKSVQNKLIDNIINILKSKKYFGVNIDFEHVLAQDRKLLNSFLEHFKSKLKKYGILLTISVPPKYSDHHTAPRYTAYDYFSHGMTADRVILMTYEWGWFGGPPMPVSPSNQIKNVLDFAKATIPKYKVMMGIPLYGHDWQIPYCKDNPLANTVNPNEAIELAQKHKTAIHFDTISQTPYFNYLDENNNQHMVWFEDARSIRAKFEMVHQFDLGGISYWSMERPFPQNWHLLNDLFRIKKVI